jgi:hypothetical protein
MKALNMLEMALFPSKFAWNFYSVDGMEPAIIPG